MSSYFFNIWSIPYFLSSLISFLLVVLLLVKKRIDKHVQLYIVSQIFVGLLALSAALATNSLDPDHWIFWSAINIITSAISVSITYHFSYVFLRNSPIFANKKLVIIYLVPLTYLTLYLYNYQLFYPEMVLVEYSQFGIYASMGSPSSGLLILFFYVYLGVMAILAAINYFRMYRQKFNLDLRRRAAYFVLSTLVPAITLTLTLFLIITVTEYRPKLELTIVSLSISGSIIAYGILKDKLFDISVIVSKSFKYTLMNIGLAWIFVISRETLTPLISELLFSGSQVSTILAGFLVVTFIIPIKNIASRATDKLIPQSEQKLTPSLGFYHKQLELAYSDGKITKKELTMLKELKIYLDISDEDHSRLVELASSKHEV